MRIKTPLILLAAGSSNRLGTPKGLYLYQGEPWLSYQLRALGTAGVSRVLPVFGRDAEAYFSTFPSLRSLAVVNPEPERGPFSSFQCGAKALGEEPCLSFVLPVDVPVPAADLFLALETALREAGEAVKAAIPQYQGKTGHPLCLTASWRRDLLLLAPSAHDARLDHQLHALGEGAIACVAVEDPGILLNLNTAADFERFHC